MFLLVLIVKTFCYYYFVTLVPSLLQLIKVYFVVYLLWNESLYSLETKNSSKIEVSNYNSKIKMLSIYLVLKLR